MTTVNPTAGLFGLNREQLEFQQRCRQFATDAIRPNAQRYDQAEETPWDVIRRAAAEGFYAPEFFLDAALDPTGRKLAIAAEEFAAGDAGIGLALLYPALPLVALMLTGTAEQQQRLVPEIFGTIAEPNLVALAASEPHAGSDVAAFSTTARLDGDTWVLTGTKRWAGNTSLAAWYFVVATVDTELGAKGHTLFAVPASAPGLSYGPKLTKLGLRAITHADLRLDEVRVPAENLIGGPEKLQQRLDRARSGLRRTGQPAMETFEATRPLISAMAVGVARAAHEEALRYATERQAFGSPIVEHQQIAAILAEQRTLIDAARLMVWRAAEMQTQRITMAAAEGSQAKLFAADVVRKVTASAVQVAGGLGFTGELALERMYRDAPIFGIFEGTSEIQSLIIASALSGRRIR